MIAGALRIALYAEGSGETWTAPPPGVSPGEVLPNESLGPGHVLVRRLVGHVSSIPTEAVQFLRPLRLADREARGSDLLNPRVLRRVLIWPQLRRAPHCSVLLLDDDGDPEKVAVALQEAANGSPPVCTIVATRSFEAWLLADHGALQSSLGVTLSTGPAPDSSDAKRILAEAIAESLRARQDMDGALLRRAIAETMDPTNASARSPSFAAAVETLRGFLANLNR